MVLGHHSVGKSGEFAILSLVRGNRPAAGRFAGNPMRSARFDFPRQRASPPYIVKSFSYFTRNRTRLLAVPARGANALVFGQSERPEHSGERERDAAMSLIIARVHSKEIKVKRCAWL